MLYVTKGHNYPRDILFFFYTYTGAHSKLGAGEKGAQRKPFFHQKRKKNDKNQKGKEKRKCYKIQ